MAERIEIQVVARGVGRTRREIEGIGRSAGSSVRGLRQLQLAISALGIGFAAREFVTLSDTVVRLDNRLNLLTGSQSATNGLFRELEQVARNTRGSLSDTVDLFSRLRRSTSDLGLSTSELLDLTTGVNQAFRIYGNNAAEAEAATIQFSQGLAAGALRGDELRSVLEQAPRLARAIADGISETEALGPGIRVGIGDLRNLGLQGVLTAEIVSTALQSQLGVLREEFEQTEITISEAFQQLGNEVLSVFREIDTESDFTQNVAQGILDLRDVIRPAITFIREFLSQFVSTAEFLQGTFNAVLGDTAGQVVTLTAIIGTLLAVLNVNPLIALATTAIALNATFAALQTSTTELTDAYFETSAAVETSAGQIEALNALLDQDRITTIETADAKIQEAISRRENIKALQDEVAQRRELLELENEQLQQNFREAARSEINIPFTNLSAFNPFERANIERQRGLLLNNTRAVVQAREDENALIDQAIQNEEQLLRLQNLRNSGTLTSVRASRELNEQRTAAQRALEQLTRQAIRQGSRAAETVNGLARSIGRIEIEAGGGEDAIKSIADAQKELTREADNVQDLIDRYEAGGVAAATLRPLVDALAEIRELEASLDPLAIQAQAQAIDDLIAEVTRERTELNLTNDEQDLRNRLRSIGLTIDNASPEQLSQLREEIGLIRQTNELREQEEELARRRLDLVSTLGRRDELADLSEQAGFLEEVLSNPDLYGNDQILDATNRLADLRQEMEEIRILANSGDFTGGLLESLFEFGRTGSEAMREFGMTVGSVTEQLTGGFADAIADAIVNGEDLGEALKSVARDAISQLISSLIQLGVQFLINQAIANTIQSASTAAGVAQASTLASAFAPAAALVSLATSGANSIAASAGIAATSALSQGIAALSLRDGGFVTGPGGPRDDAVPAMLSNGEFVVNAQATRDNKALLEAINSDGRRPSNSRVTNVTMNLPGVTDADSFGRSERQIEKNLQRRLNR